jgi:hypothetical protein
VTELGWQFLLVLTTVVVLGAAAGLVHEYLHRHRARLPALLTADRSRARATLSYYVHVHDSSD